MSGANRSAPPSSGSETVFTDPANWTHTAGENQYHGTGEGIHLTGDPALVGSAGSGPNLIALGVNGGGVGLFINNYTTGVGLKITNRNTGSNTGAWGFLLGQNSDTAEGMYLSQETSTAKMPLKIVNAPIGPVGGGGASTNQILTEWRRSQAATGDTLLARALVDSWLFQVPVTVSSANLTVSGGTLTADTIFAQAAAANINIYDTAGTAAHRRWKITASSGVLDFSARDDAGGSSVDILTLNHTNGNLGTKDGAAIVAGSTTGLKIGSATTQKLGFYNATPVVQPSGTPAAATDAATTQTLVNDLRTKLLSLGLVA